MLWFIGNHEWSTKKLQETDKNLLCFLLISRLKSSVQNNEWKIRVPVPVISTLGHRHNLRYSFYSYNNVFYPFLRPDIMENLPSCDIYVILSPCNVCVTVWLLLLVTCKFPPLCQFYVSQYLSRLCDHLLVTCIYPLLLVTCLKLLRPCHVSVAPLFLSRVCPVLLVVFMCPPPPSLVYLSPLLITCISHWHVFVRHVAPLCVTCKWHFYSCHVYVSPSSSCHVYSPPLLLVTCVYSSSFSCVPLTS